MDGFSKQDFIRRLNKGQTADEIKNNFLTVLEAAQSEYNRQKAIPQISRSVTFSYYPALHRHTITIIV